MNTFEAATILLKLVGFIFFILIFGFLYRRSKLYPLTYSEFNFRYENFLTTDFYKKMKLLAIIILVPTVSVFFVTLGNQTSYNFIRAHRFEIGIALFVWLAGIFGYSFFKIKPPFARGLLILMFILLTLLDIVAVENPDEQSGLIALDFFWMCTNISFFLFYGFMKMGKYIESQDSSVLQKI